MSARKNGNGSSDRGIPAQYRKLNARVKVLEIQLAAAHLRQIASRVRTIEDELSDQHRRLRALEVRGAAKR